MPYKCLHYRFCKSYVDYVNGKGWVHMPQKRSFCMQHEKLSKKRLAWYNIGEERKRSKGCGWRGIQPADVITWDTDICPSCGAQGELADHHIASPRYPKQKGRKPKNGISQKKMRAMRKQLIGCTIKCRTALSNDCDCVCNGSNHGASFTMRLFN